jgi:hypothetical protein
MLGKKQKQKMSVLWTQSHEEGRAEHVDMTEEKYAIAYLGNQTRKYGVELPEPTENPLTPSESYWKWFRFYDDHFKNVLSKEDLEAFVKAKKTGEYILPFMPKGSWKV